LPRFFGKKPHNTTSIAAFFACELRQYPRQIRTPELISASFTIGLAAKLMLMRWFIRLDLVCVARVIS
jgi:hypothetical protein